jgi:hypothetical protein
MIIAVDKANEIKSPHNNNDDDNSYNEYNYNVLQRIITSHTHTYKM